MHRPGDGHSGLPLLSDTDTRDDTGHSYDADAAPHLSQSEDFPSPSLSHRRLHLHSQSPNSASRALATRKKYTYAAFFLLLSLISFTIQTETAVYIQTKLGWQKSFCMLYFTHSSWSLLWPVQLLILKSQKRSVPWRPFLRAHFQQLRTTAQMIVAKEVHLSPRAASQSPIPYFLRMTAFVTTALTVAGSSWYVAVHLTTASDLTAIYNCSAFFAYAFSVPLLHEKLRLDKSISVLVAIAGVLAIAYGDTSPDDQSGARHRTLGNIVTGVGSVLYGFYEVLYKKFACPPEGTSPGRAMIFANAFGSGVGIFTISVLWIPLTILHFTGLETFELPVGKTAWVLLISVLANATFSGSFLILISLTSPVLSSVAALLTIFIVAVVDYYVTGKPLSPAAIAGGLVIVGAFAGLSWSTWRELVQERAKGDGKEDNLDEDDDDDEGEEGEDEDRVFNEAR